MSQTNDIDPLLKDQIAQIVDERLSALLPDKLKEIEASKTRSLAVLATKGTLDWAYPTFIFASTAAALGWNVSVFFTFYGLELLKKDLKLKISPLGNPAMPMKMPFGPGWFKGVNWKIPNLVMAGIPGFEATATKLMKQTMRINGVATVEELREISIEAGAKVVACQMSMDVFGFTKDDFIDEIDEYAGAATFMEIVSESDATLLV